MVDVVPNFAVPMSDEALTKQTNVLALANFTSTAKQLFRSRPSNSPCPEVYDELLVRARNVAQGTRTWTPAAGVVRSFQRAEDFDAGAIQLALLLTALGGWDSWSGTLSRPTTFLLGVNTLELDGRFEVKASPSRIEIAGASLPAPIVFEAASEGVWLPAPDGQAGGRVQECGAHLEAAGLLDKFVLPLKGNPNMTGEKETERTDFLEAINPGERDLAAYAAVRIAQAYDMIDTVAPQYSLYTRLLVRGVGAYPAGLFGHGQRSSGSSSDYPGLYTCTFPGALDWLAETLVHESSHQHLNLLTSVFPLTEGDDGKRYYSSIKGKPRTLRRQILGYHAVVNITLFRRNLIDRLGHSAHRKRELDLFEQYAVDMRAELDGATTYTDEGRTFVERLNAQLAG